MINVFQHLIVLKRLTIFFQKKLVPITFIELCFHTLKLPSRFFKNKFQNRIFFTFQTNYKQIKKT